MKQLRYNWSNDLNAFSMKIGNSLAAFKSIAEDLTSRMSTCKNQITEIKNNSINI